MAAQGIEYVELYANDKQGSLDYFVQSMGFTAVADGGNSTLLRQGKVQLIVTAGPAAKEFLDAHGDGIADIALTCDDPAATRDVALAAGSAALGDNAGRPVVSGFGHVRHTLLPLAASPGGTLPAGWPWQPRPGPSLQPSGPIGLLDHVAVCIDGESLAQFADFYGKGFGLARYSSEYVELGDQAMDSIVVRSPSGGVTFTLVAPDPARSAGQLNAFLDRNDGPGVQHLAFAVDDIIPTVREFRDRGVEFLSTPGRYYDLLAQRLSGMAEGISDLRDTDVLADRDEWGYLLQLFTRSPHERNTLFYELIQRRGARGFGSSNIKALYEAVERDRLDAEQA